MEEKIKQIKLIAGLGNPTFQYENTYHNIGKLFLKYIIQKIITPKEKVWNIQKNFKYIKKKLNSKKIYFVLTNTFMNNSGQAIKEAINKFKIMPTELLIIHDDGDLIIGNFKYSFGKGSGGHHGVESIFKEINSRNFWRLRIGIRPPNKFNIRAENIVLKKITKKDKIIFYSIFEKLTTKLIEKINLSS